jgi:hypothetical protein
MQNQFNKTVRDEYFDLESKKSTQMARIQENLINHLEKRQKSMGRPRVEKVERSIQNTPLLHETFKNMKYYMQALDELGELDVDNRVLNLFRITVNREYKSFQTISEVEFHKFFYQSFR